MKDFMGGHDWVNGEWSCYGDYIHRDDQCKCGCVRRMALNKYGMEVVDFYEMDNNFFFHPRQCQIKLMLSVKIVADPTVPDAAPKYEFRVHKPIKIDYFDAYNC